MVETPRPLIWMGDAKKQLLAFPDIVRREMGFALYLAQRGDRHPHVKPLKGHKEFAGGAVVEVVEDFDGDTFRTVYTARFGSEVYVLHAFQKKSKRGIATPQRDIDLIVRRLKDARALHERQSRGERGPR